MGNGTEEGLGQAAAAGQLGGLSLPGAAVLPEEQPGHRQAQVAHQVHGGGGLLGGAILGGLHGAQDLDNQGEAHLCKHAGDEGACLAVSVFIVVTQQYC